MTTAIRIENVSKLYRLGTVGTGTISHDLNRWWHKIRGKEDPYTKVGQVNDRAARSEPREASDENSPNSPVAARRSVLSRRSLLATRDSYVWALRDINLEVKQGKILGIIGSNGAGKSTLLKLLSRVTAPTTGEIKIRGRIASLLEVGTGFHPEMTGRENVYMNGTILGMKREEITRKFDDIISFSGCQMYVDTPVKRYSSGMTVRLGFAVAAFLQPQVLIIDEVLAVADAQFQSQCFSQLRALTQSGITVIFVSHNMSAVASLTEDAAILDCGALKQLGRTREVIDQYLSMQRDRIRPLLDTSDRSGDGRVRITAFCPCDRTGIPVTSATNGQTTYFKIDYKTAHPAIRLDNCIVSILLNRNDAAVWFVRSDFTQSPITLCGPSGSLICEVKDFAVAEGNYIAHLFLSHRDNEILDYIVDAAEVSVVTGDFFPDRYPGLPAICPILTRATWKVI